MNWLKNLLRRWDLRAPAILTVMGVLTIALGYYWYSGRTYVSHNEMLRHNLQQSNQRISDLQKELDEVRQQLNQREEDYQELAAVTMTGECGDRALQIYTKNGHLMITFNGKIFDWNEESKANHRVIIEDGQLNMVGDSPVDGEQEADVAVVPEMPRLPPRRGN